jgi:hypothetical protein
VVEKKSILPSENILFTHPILLSQLFFSCTNVAALIDNGDGDVGETGLYFFYQRLY